MIHEQFQLIEAALGPVLAQHRHKSDGKGALGKETAQEIGNLEGDEEGIGLRIRAEDVGKD
jgi:hypothetical protein